MSAIAGLLDCQGTPVERSSLERMSAALAAHGPDGAGVWQDASVGLLHRRTIFTPQDCLERQPLSSPDGQVVLTSAARLDNRPELAQSLSLLATQLADTPDSQFILQAYLRWGMDCPAHLIGDYSFALWDNRERALLLVRSPFSGRPLFYHASERLFAFATMPKGLFALPTVPRELDADYVARVLAGAARPPDATFYRGIHSLPPGCRMIVRDGRRDVRPFWEPDFRREIRFGRDQDYLEAFHALFSRVMTDHARAAGPVGVMLSGGLDSSAVAAVAAPILAENGRRLAAFTEVPRPGFQTAPSSERYADETPFVRAIAALYPSLDLHLVRTDGSHLLHGVDRYLDATETPFRNACNRVWIEAILSEAQTQGVRVLLAGFQGNLGLSWKGETPQPSLLRRGHWGAAMQEARALAPNGQAGSVLRTLLVQGLLPTRVGRALAALRASRRPAPPSLLRHDYARRHGIPAGTRPTAPRAGSPEESRRARCRVMQRTTHASSPVWTGYQALYGVEVRDPTCDVRLVEFCLALPEDQFRRDGVSRRLVRQAMTGLLPPEVLWNPRRGLQAADWGEQFADGRRDLLDALNEMERSDAVRELMDTDALRRALQKPALAGFDTRHFLETGLMMGSFVRWFEAGQG